MLIFWKQRFVLLAVPKTGTTAIESALGPMADAAISNPPGLKHCNVKKYRRELSPFFEQKGRRPLELVAVMREPTDWLGSWYRYRTRPALNGQPNSTAQVDFEEFVENYLADPQPDFARVGSQAHFLEGGVDHLFRYGAREALLHFLEDRFGKAITLPRLNVSPPGDVRLSRTLKDRLRRERAADFDLWSSLA